MQIKYTPVFKKQYKKLTTKLKNQFGERLKLFMDDPTHPRLRVHPLLGKYVGYWSLNVSGDLRALYRQEGDEIVIFGFIGTHSQLYG